MLKNHDFTSQSQKGDIFVGYSQYALTVHFWQIDSKYDMASPPVRLWHSRSMDVDGR
jgi:hypothetical protein